MNGRGRLGGNKAGAGPNGKCICPQCGKEVEHRRGEPCYRMRCPKCGHTMLRK